MSDPAESLRYISAELGDLRRRYRRDGQYWPSLLESLYLLAASGGQTRPIREFDMNMGDDRLALDYETAARRLTVSRRTIRRLVASGELPKVEIGGCARITKADIEAFVEGLQRERESA